MLVNGACWAAAHQEVQMSEEDLQLLVTIDDPWNAQECDTFYNAEPEHLHVLGRSAGSDQERHDFRAEDNYYYTRAM